MSHEQVEQAGPGAGPGGGSGVGSGAALLPLPVLVARRGERVEDLAYELRSAQSTVRRWLHGEAMPRKPMADRLNARYGGRVDFNWFYLSDAERAAQVDRHLGRQGGGRRDASGHAAA